MKTETILELADKATENTSDNASDQFCLTFAELIVRECISYLHQRGVEGFGVLEERNLKEHFGIEE